MNEVMKYIFSSLQTTEGAVKELCKLAGKQSRINRRMALFTIYTTAYIITSELKRKEQEERIKSLINDIEELKKMKGE